MPAALQNIRAAMTSGASQGAAPRWDDLRAELFSAVSSPLTLEVERLLLAILSFEGELQLDETSPMPHRMSPENMLKSLAVQYLGRWTGARYLRRMQWLLTTAKPALACMVRGVIQQVSA